jgi:uncharacterized protein
MHTKAVFRSAQALNDAGFHVLRFNFRGVGQSTGTHDHGVGEKEDARAALDWLAAEFPGLPLLLGGFSFGSAVALRLGLQDPRVKALLGLGLPVAKYDLSDLAKPAARGDRPLLLVQGEEDEFGTGAEVEAFAQTLGPKVSVARIPGADHYFHDHFDELREAVESYFGQGEGSLPFPLVEGGGGS